MKPFYKNYQYFGPGNNFKLGIGYFEEDKFRASVYLMLEQMISYIDAQCTSHTL